MDIRAIKDEANQLFKDNYKTIIPAFYLIYCFQTIIQMLTSGFAAVIGEFVLVTVSHGFIYLALKLLHQGDLKDISLKDVFIGLLHFPGYFPSYFIRQLIIVLPSFIFVALSLVISIPVDNDLFYTVADQFLYLIVSEGFKFDYFLNVISSLNNWTFILIAIGLITYALLTILLALVPCIVEDYDYAWNEAITYSVKMMKGHFKEFIRLLLSLLPEVCVYWVLSIVASYLVFIIPIMSYSIYLILTILLSICTYRGKYYIMVALFYKQIREETHSPMELFKI